jgi:hypothetical protein
MGKFSNTLSLMDASWQILQKDKKLLIFPLISGICCLIVFASFAIPQIASGISWHPPGKNAAFIDYLTYYGPLYLLYFCNYFIIVFFNVAIVACAMIRMEDGEPTITDGLSAAIARLPLIAGWALLSATVGLILRLIEDRSAKLGQFVAGLLGVAWTIASFLVIPILVLEKTGPIAALSDSATLLKKTWGEQLISNFSFGLVFTLFGLVAIIPVGLGFMTGTKQGMLTGISVAVIYLLILSLIQSTLQTIFQAALYLYVQDGQAPPGFQADLLKNAISKK